MHLPTRWTRRLLALARTEQTTGTSISTLEMFFTDVRWQEDVDAHGRKTLRRGAL